MGDHWKNNILFGCVWSADTDESGLQLLKHLLVTESVGLNVFELVESRVGLNKKIGIPFLCNEERVKKRKKC